jgi:hypothetical protein
MYYTNIAFMHEFGNTITTFLIYINNGPFWTWNLQQPFFLELVLSLLYSKWK